MIKTPLRFAATPLMALAVAGAAPLSAQAQSMTSGWEFEAAIYGWFPAISGSTAFPPNGGGPSIDVSMKDVIDALKFAFMGSLQARHGQWGVWTDLVYADFGASKQGSRSVSVGGIPIDVDTNVVLDVKSWIWTLAGTYTLKNDTEGTTDLLFGTRLLDMKNTLSWSATGSGPGSLPSRTGTAEVTENNWDAIVGLKGRAFIGNERKWFVPYYLDIGTGESKFTWQVNGGIGYSFDWGAVVASWRYLDYSFKSSSRVTDMSFSGPLIGVAFKF
jgi:hypothetical protein